MKNFGSRRFAILFTVCFAICNALVAQRIGVNTQEVETLIQEWNFANNSRNTESFRNVYGDKLLFYTQNISERKAIQLKQQLFKLKPNFEQRIITPITYTPYTSGLIKCDFTKEVYETSRWKKYPSYLLVSYEDKRYQIVGESDNATDRVLKFSLDLGEPMTFENIADADTLHADSQSISKMSSSVLDSMKSLLQADRVSSMFSDVSAMGVVMVPKSYVYILIGILTLGGLMIFAADSAQSKKRARLPGGAMIQTQDEAEQVVRDFKMQSVFEDFVVTLFDPLYFRYKRPKAERVYAGKIAGDEPTPDFIFEFTQKDVHAQFAVKCQYYKHVAKNEVHLFPADVVRGFRQFEQEKEMDVYYILGFGGAPDDPKELFFLPAKAIEDEYVTKGELRRYSKSGMFYYSNKTRRIH